MSFALVCGKGPKDNEKARLTHLAKQLSQLGAVYLRFPKPNKVNVIAFTTSAYSEGLSDNEEVKMNEYIDTSVTFLAGLEYLQKCASIGKTSELEPLPELKKEWKLFPSGVIVVSDFNGLMTIPDAHDKVRGLLDLLRMGKSRDPDHHWVLKVSSQVASQIIQRQESDGNVRRVWNLLNLPQFSRVFQVMERTEESSNLKADPPKAIRDAVKMAHVYRTSARWVFFMHGDVDHVPEGDKEAYSYLIQIALGQATLLTCRMDDVISKTTSILKRYY